MCRRHLGSSCSYFITQSRSACSSTATDVYFTPSDVRARSSVVMPVAIKTLAWQPRHVIQTLNRFSSRRLELQLAPSCLAQRWMFWRRWSLSSSASWYAGVFLQLPTYRIFLGLACTPLQLLVIVMLLPVFIWIVVLSASVHNRCFESLSSGRLQYFSLEERDSTALLIYGDAVFLWGKEKKMWH